MLLAQVIGVILLAMFLIALGFGTFALAYDWAMNDNGNFWPHVAFAGSLMLLFAWSFLVIIAAIVLLNRVGSVSLS